MTILQDYLKDLEELVNFDSGSLNVAGVTRAAGIMARHFQSIGFTTELVDLGPKAGKGLLATNKPGAERYDVMLNGHLDTVFPDGTAAQRPFSLDEEKAYGPGVLDCKAGVLSAFYGIKTARKEDIDKLAIVVALNPDEELLSPYSCHWLLETGKKSERVLICEPARANGALVRSRKGSHSYRVTFHGKSAHAGNNPQDGHNAAVAMMRFALALYDERNDFVKGHTVNPGIVKSGEIVNAIPDEAVLELDTRYWWDQDGRDTEKVIRRLAAMTWVEGVTCEVESTGYSPAMPLSDATKDLVATMTEAARQVGFEPMWVDAGGASDGNHIAESGVPVIDGIGPAGDNMHTAAEYLRLNTIERQVSMQAAFYSLIKPLA